jgi:hypothetical protein
MTELNAIPPCVGVTCRDSLTPAAQHDFHQCEVGKLNAQSIDVYIWQITP